MTRGILHPITAGAHDAALRATHGNAAAVAQLAQSLDCSVLTARNRLSALGIDVPLYRQAPHPVTLGAYDDEIRVMRAKGQRALAIGVALDCSETTAVKRIRLLERGMVA